MKKAYLILALLLVAALVVAVVPACGESATPTKAAAPATATSAPAVGTPTKAATTPVSTTPVVTPTAVMKGDSTGVTASEIILGGTFPLSGPVSPAGTTGKAINAYFQYLNANGGINGRKLTYKFVDDAYQPAKTLQMTRQLVEEDKVFAMVGSLGTATQTSVQDYLTEKKVPLLFVASGASKWGADPVKYPWTTGPGMTNYSDEGILFAKYIMAEKPTAKIAILFQNDDMGKEYVENFEKQLGDKKSMILKKIGFESTVADLSSQVSDLKATGADTVWIISTATFVAKGLKAIADSGWKPFKLVASSGSSMAGIGTLPQEMSEGAISTIFYKDPNDPQWNNDAGMKLHRELMGKYAPDADLKDAQNIFGNAIAWLAEQTFKGAGQNLTREGAMAAAANLNFKECPFLMPGIVVKTTATDWKPIRSFQTAKFTAGKWVPFGNVIDARN